ncbi:hypothetical protein [Streptomyces sp. MST-110588]|uniref:hypothetical protein n=1 Tax=Streptomyces sp. MST-110588 TaxID=2833628 RepID=UPI001F5C93B7|nr:hypothetical protein [Streptomyces sp. MST-110588]UNO40494.1 hypothetical protein KGS77_14065 [Streptomyces sp. MST-110588]
MAENEANRRMALSIYNSIFNAVTGTSDTGQSGYDPKKTYLTMEPSGRLIDPKDYANPWTPGNKTGNKGAAYNIAQLAYEVHEMSPATSISSVRAVDVYQQILRANTSDPELDDSAKQRIQEAQAVLKREVTVTDDETGKPVQKTVETVMSREYTKLRQKYYSARLSYMMAYLKAQETDSGRQNWPLLGPTLRGPVTGTYDDWRAAHANEVESAIAVLATNGNKQVALAFAAAKKLFDGYGVDLTGTPELTYRSAVYPTGWTSAELAEDWPTATVTQGSQETSSSEEAHSYAASAGIKNGIWGWGGGVEGGGSKYQSHLSEETKNLKVSFQYCLCTISRPWLDGTLFSTPHWKTSQYDPGTISTGKRDQSGTALPMLPVSFLCLRNVSITADWHKSDSENANRAAKFDSEVTWGPFKLAGYSQNDESRSHHMRADWDGSTLTQKGLQIVGWLHSIVPYCPPTS